MKSFGIFHGVDYLEMLFHYCYAVLILYFQKFIVKNSKKLALHYEYYPTFTNKTEVYNNVQV